MDAIRPRLHPLLTVAAISVTVLSAVGVGAMLPVIVGGVRSTFTVTIAVDAFPAVSVATT